MKILKYTMCTVDEYTTEDGIVTRQVLTPVNMIWSEANEKIAKHEAYNGEYTIEDNGAPEPVIAPTQLDVIEAQVVYTAMMTDTLLEV